MDFFEQATRHKVRFDTVKGPIDCEMLWTLPLTSDMGKPCLNDLAVRLDRELSLTSKSFVDEGSGENPLTRLMFNCVLRVIEVKKEENKARRRKAENAAKREEILAALQQANRNEIAAKTPAELEKMLAELSD